MTIVLVNDYLHQYTRWAWQARYNSYIGPVIDLGEPMTLSSSCNLHLKFKLACLLFARATKLLASLSRRILDVECD